MALFRDNFIPVSKFGKVSHKNTFELIPGEVLERFQHDELPDVQIIEMSTGVFYFRYNTYADVSPYGWNYLHEYFYFQPEPILTGENRMNLEAETIKHLAEFKSLDTHNKFIKALDFKKYLQNKFCELKLPVKILE